MENCISPLSPVRSSSPTCRLDRRDMDIDVERQVKRNKETQDEMPYVYMNECPSAVADIMINKTGIINKPMYKNYNNK